MTSEQKKSIEDIVCYRDGNEKLVLLLDYKIYGSVIEKNDDGSPRQLITIRYKVVDHVWTTPNPKARPTSGKEGSITRSLAPGS